MDSSRYCISQKGPGTVWASRAMTISRSWPGSYRRLTGRPRRAVAGGSRRRRAAGAAARREIAEETGLDGIVLPGALGTIDWFFRVRGRLIHKYCHFFLFESPEGTPVPQAEEGIQRCEWHDAAAALETVTHENARGVLREAIGRVRALCRPETPAPRA